MLYSYLPFCGWFWVTCKVLTSLTLKFRVKKKCYVLCFSNINNDVWENTASCIFFPLESTMLVFVDTWAINRWWEERGLPNPCVCHICHIFCIKPYQGIFLPSLGSVSSVINQATSHLYVNNHKDHGRMKAIVLVSSSWWLAIVECLPEL